MKGEGTNSTAQSVIGLGTKMKHVGAQLTLVV